MADFVVVFAVLCMIFMAIRTLVNMKKQGKCLGCSGKDCDKCTSLSQKKLP